jgi:hypothetical protein
MTALIISGLALADAAISGKPAPAEAFNAALHSTWSAPRAADFARAGAQLAPAIQALCNAPAEQAEPALQQARQGWLTTLDAWERLSAVAIGPVLERRSQRQIDFTPTRPRLIEKAVKSAPADAAAMELIGTPAKGLPALEWLLWVKPAQPASPECRYAVQVAAEIGREAQALASARISASKSQAELTGVALKDAPEHASLARSPSLAGRVSANMPKPFDGRGACSTNPPSHPPAPLPPAGEGSVERRFVSNTLNELLNQWIGGLERLRWANMEMPARVALTGAKEAPDFPRRASGASALAWAAQWEALRGLASGSISLESALRERERSKTADTLAQAVRAADADMRDLAAKDTPRILAAAKTLAALKRLVENEVAPALGVSIGFSDADGD